MSRKIKNLVTCSSDKSRHEWVMSRCLTYKGVTSHMNEGHVTYILMSCITYEWVLLHVYESRHVTSRHVTSRHVTSRHVTSRHIMPQTAWRASPRATRHIEAHRTQMSHVTSHITSRHVMDLVTSFSSSDVMSRTNEARHVTHECITWYEFICDVPCLVRITHHIWIYTAIHLWIHMSRIQWM